MNNYFLAIPLPYHIHTQLKECLCYGLPGIHWTEEGNFHLTLRFFSRLTETVLRSVQDRLKDLFFNSFSMILHGISHTRSAILIGINDNEDLKDLRKEVDKQLRDLYLPAIDPHFRPHVTLGTFDRLNHERMLDYLTSHHDFQTLPIEVNQCTLMRSLHTPKHTIYETVCEYAASKIYLGED